MRDDDINMICTYEHRDICGKMGDQSRVGAVVRFDSRIGTVDDLRDSGFRELGTVGRFDSRESRVKESGSGSEGSRVRESGIAGKCLRSIPLMIFQSCMTV